mgnify:FL=1
MIKTAEYNCRMLDTIEAAKISFTVRKYAGAWVPIIVKGGKRKSFAHCSTSGGAWHIAMREAYKEALK